MRQDRTRRIHQDVERIVWEYAGSIGIDPSDKTLANIVNMHRGKLRLEWDKTASLMALIANVNRGKHAKARKPKDFHPLREPPRKPLTKAENKRNFGLLRKLLEENIKGGESMKVVKLKAKKPCSESSTR